MSLIDWETRLADRLGRYKSASQRKKKAVTGALETWLDYLGIKPLPRVLECTLVECTMTRGKYRSGWRAFFNWIVKACSSTYSIMSQLPPTELYEVVRQWKTDKDFTVSEIIYPIEPVESEEFFKSNFKKGQHLRITRYSSVWHPLHRWGLMLNAFIQGHGLLDVGSSVEVYPKPDGIEVIKGGHDVEGA